MRIRSDKSRNVSFKVKDIIARRRARMAAARARMEEDISLSLLEADLAAVRIREEELSPINDSQVPTPSVTAPCTVPHTGATGAERKTSFDLDTRLASLHITNQMPSQLKGSDIQQQPPPASPPGSHPAGRVAAQNHQGAEPCNLNTQQTSPHFPSSVPSPTQS
ncbi:hypothetical protein CF319_g4710 [Tilletia indica]|nr:hypothetical protein CF319_g4710 [Tilletia indica]KAE8232850.1 hypothetical protein CF326_g2116 [Tilletia indica]